jgi:cytochrome c-type biogenesis protein
MDALFTYLTDAMEGSFPLALLASGVWGVLSILLSPCHLTSIPLVIGFLTSQGEKKPSRGILLAFVFAIGILLTIAVVGTVTALSGRIMGDVGPYGKFVIAAVFFVAGLYLMDIIRLPETGVQLRALRLRSVFIAAFALGLIFGAALGPCTFAFMAPVLVVVFQMAGTNTIAAGAVLLSFAIGHCAVIVVTGGLSSRVHAYLEWTNRSSVLPWIKRGSGLLVVLGGFYTLFFS